MSYESQLNIIFKALLAQETKLIVRQFAIYSVLGLTYLGLAFGEIPSLRMNRATIALVGSAFLIGIGVLNGRDAWQAIDATTIVFLLSMMVVNANLAYAGFFRRSLVFYPFPQGNHKCG